MTTEPTVDRDLKSRRMTFITSEKRFRKIANAALDEKINRTQLIEQAIDFYLEHK